jgi:3-deoxy-D-manno-octulosonic-acid transferase
VYKKYIEAEELVEVGGAFTVDNALELEATFNNLLSNETIYTKACTDAGNYVASKTGATSEIVGYITTNSLIL